MKLLRNLEGVRKNRPLAKSEVGSTIASLKSRASNYSARVSTTHAGPVATSMNNGRLSKIDESPGDGKYGYCEVCPNNEKEITEEDSVVNEEISKSVVED